MSKMTDKWAIGSKQYTADDVYKVIKQGVRNISQDDVMFVVCSFNEEEIWLYDEAGEFHTTYEKIAQILNTDKNSIKFYRLEEVEI